MFVDIGGLQHFAVETFKKMRVAQIRDPSLPPLSSLPASYRSKIALVGAGPSSISCATFLARLGYTDLTIFEKGKYAGGLSSSEIPQYRLPFAAVSFEIQLMLDLGVKIVYDKALGRDFTVQSLHNEGYVAVFVGIGAPDAKVDAAFNGITTEQGFWTSKDLLPAVSLASKPRLSSAGGCSGGSCGGCGSGAKSETATAAAAAMPDLRGRVIVLGAGDTAFDCAGSAFRCGASRVTVVFRRGFTDIRAVPEEVEHAIHEKCEFLPYCAPRQVIMRDGRVHALEMYKMEKDLETGEYVRDDDQLIRVRCDHIVSAFGSHVGSAEVLSAMAPLKVSDMSGLAAYDPLSGTSLDAPWVFCGGDIVGSSTTVEAVNDGKTASWHLHRFVQSLSGIDVGNVAKLPGFFTEIDKVDLSVTTAGLRFPNPFGLASATPCTSASIIRRAFEAGWGFAVTKTFAVERDWVTNVSPRIVRGTTSGPKYGPGQTSFLNIELISEKSAEYWCESIRELKQDFPDRIIIASVMAAFVKEDWQELVRKSCAAGADAVELNLSCPHGMGERGMGLACGQREDLVHDICKWVKEVCTVPFFAKMTPNITDVTLIAGAARDGGATGVTAVNTVSGLMSMRPHSAEPWPAVGASKRTTYGGVSGVAVRPIALRAVSAIAQRFPDYPVLATGGADTAESVLEFLYCGASVVQICSAVQNQDLTVVQDYTTGLQCLLYMQARADLADTSVWDGQSHIRSSETVSSAADSTKRLPRFGPYERARRAQRQAEVAAADGPLSVPDVLAAETESEAHLVRPAPAVARAVPRLNELVGKALGRLGPYSKLDNKAQVVAVVNDERCINCGKCYMTCNDAGYQAITFDAQTHLPTVTDDCTGCTLCLSVCPIYDCITMVPRVTEYVPDRGIPAPAAAGSDGVVMISA